jgi:hypothetical protein
VSKVQVQCDNRVRLAGAILAATVWPEMEQVRETHAVHYQAKVTRQYMRQFSQKAAVTRLNQMLQADMPIYKPFAVLTRCSWPQLEPEERLPTTFADGLWLYETTKLYAESDLEAALWQPHAADWAEATSQLAAIFENAALTEFLGRLRRRPLQRTILIYPNLLYPALQPVVIQTRHYYGLVLPPPKAVGESPPWPYAEAVDWVLTTSCQQLLRHVMVDELKGKAPGEQALLLHAASSCFLEETLGREAADAYMRQLKRQCNLSDLCEAVEKLKRKDESQEER